MCVGLLATNRFFSNIFRIVQKTFIFRYTIFVLHLVYPHLSHTPIQFKMHEVFRFSSDTLVCSLFFCHCGFYFLSKDEMKNISSPVYVFSFVQSGLLYLIFYIILNFFSYYFFRRPNNI